MGSRVVGVRPSGLAAFALAAFTFVGIGLLIAGATWWWRLFALQSWLRVPVAIEHVEWETVYRQGLRERHAIDCRYSYEVGGERFVSTRVYPGGDPESSADCTTLEWHLEQQRPFLGFVDPTQPGRSVLVPHVDGLMVLVPLMGLFFFLVGSSLALNMWLRMPTLLPGGTNESPWLRVRSFRDRVIRPRRRTALLVIGWIGGVSIATLIVCVFAVGLEHRRGVDPTILVVVSGLATALVATIFAIYAIGMVRFGAVRLELSSVPFWVGGEVSARLVVPRGLGDGQRIRLVFEHVTMAAGRSWPRKRRWRVETVAESGGVIPVAWGVPPDGLGTDEVGERRTSWFVRARVRGVLIAGIGVFELPIYDRPFPSELLNGIYGGRFDVARQWLDGRPSEHRPDAWAYDRLAGRLLERRDVAGAERAVRILRFATTVHPDHEPGIELLRQAEVELAVAERRRRRRRR